MASIKIAELRPAGSELFQDSESFLNELTEKEAGKLLGADGGIGVVSQATVSVGISLLTQTAVSQFNFGRRGRR